MLKPTTIAIPLYFLLIAIELIAVQFKKQKLYRLNDSITNLNAGASQQVVGILMKLVGITLYSVIYEYGSLGLVANLPPWVNFILLFIAWDFCYYWAHRMSHEVNLFWSGHVVHHQSEEYNLSVALRQSWFQAIWTAPFYIPLALVGFSPEQVVYVSGINLIYQFWIHTELVRNMGVLEWVLNTPSHHRVHHGRNPKYIDKNHAGVFIIWDRMFGTFQKEEEPVVYGITSPLNSWNPVWANFAHFKSIGQQLKEVKSIGDAFKVLFKKPGWSAKMQGYVEIPQVTRANTPKFHTQVPVTVNWYVVFQYVIATVGVAFFLFKVNELSDSIKIVASALIILWVATTGALFEGKKWAFLLEAFRLTLTFGIVIGLLVNISNFQLYVIVFTMLLLISKVWLFTFHKNYLNQKKLSPQIIQVNA